MRTPLFVLMRAAKEQPGVPDGLRHSGILALHWMRNNGRNFLYFAKPMNGVDAIDAIADRIFREHWPVTGKRVARVRAAIAESVYEHATPLSNYLRNHVQPLLEHVCSREPMKRSFMGVSLLHDRGGMRWPRREVMPIHPVKCAPCKWCGRRVFPKPSWPEFQCTKGYSARGVHCNSKDCRRMNWLQNTPQKRGGIDLTPRQRASLDYEAWDTQRALNYLLLIAKEKTHGSNSARHVR